MVPVATLIAQQVETHRANAAADKFEAAHRATLKAARRVVDATGDYYTDAPECEDAVAELEASIAALDRLTEVTA